MGHPRRARDPPLGLDSPDPDDPSPADPIEPLFPVAPDAREIDVAAAEPDKAGHPVAPSIAHLTHHDDQAPEPATIPVALDETPAPSNEQLPPYEEFAGNVTPALEASRQQLREGLVAIVEAEGPVLGHRLHIAYVKASGGDRVGKTIASVLNRAISNAVRDGTLVADKRRGESGVKPRTYRLPSQPQSQPRQLGPRALDHVPPAELADLLSQAAAQHGWDHDETLYRTVLERLGLRRLTSNVEATLASALQLARTTDERDAGEESEDSLSESVDPRI